MRLTDIGDLNNDKTNDLVMVDAAGTTLTVYYFIDSTKSYSNSASFQLPTGCILDQVIPTNNPTKLQNLIVMCSTSDTESNLYYYEQTEFTSGESVQYSWDQKSSELNSINLYPGSQPLALDINGD